MKNLLFGLLVLLGSFGAPAPELSSIKSENEALKCEVATLQQCVQNQQQNIDSLSTLLTNPKVLSERMLNNPEVFNVFKEESILIGTNIQLKKGVNPRLSAELYEALLEYSGPPVLATSICRPGSKRSKHKHGNAIDLRIDWPLLQWLHTTEGKRWIDKYSLTVYIESDKRYSEFWKTWKYSQFAFYNPLATGPHVHISR